MSDELDPDMPERDASGRFRSRKPGPAHRVDDPAEWHPAARLLFGWTTGKRVGALMFWGVLALSGGLIFADILVHHHPKFAIEQVFGFYGLYGFAAFAFVVLMGWPLGRMLRRDENFYGDAEVSDGADGEDVR